MPRPNKPQIHVGPRPFVELVSSLCALAEGAPLPFRSQLQLADEDHTFLKTLARFRAQGFEFFEFALHLDHPDQPLTSLRMAASIRRMSDASFAHTFFGGDLEPDLVDILTCHFGKLDSLLSRDLKHSPCSHAELKAVFGDLPGFRRGFDRLARCLAPHLEIDPSLYAPLSTRIHQRLEEHSPLEVAQGLMGKTFKRISDYTRYWFVPTQHYTRKPMRTFSEDTLMVVVPMADPQPRAGALEQVKFLKALGDPGRLAMVRRLAQEPCTGTTLAQELGLTTATITHHLDQLRACGLIHEERDGTSKYLSLNHRAYEDLLKALALPDASRPAR